MLNPGLEVPESRKAETGEALAKVTEMEKELVDVRAQREKDIEAVDQKGYDNGYDEATTEYKGQMEEITAELWL